MAGTGNAALLLAALLLSAPFARGAPPPAGTIVTSTAAGHYTDPASGQQVGLVSNTVNANLVPSSPPALAVTLTASSASSTPGATVGLTTAAQNSGADAAPINIEVNGASTSLFVLLLPIPANTTFAGTRTGTAGAQMLYQLLGSPVGSYVTTVPQGAVVDAVAWALADLAAGASLAGQLNVTVNANASGSFSATASAQFAASAGAAPQSIASNTLSVQLPVIPASIGYYVGSSYTTPSVNDLPGSPLYVQLNAAACNIDPTRTLTLPITMSSSLSGDVETLTATETAPNTGLFRIQPNVPTSNAVTQPVVHGDGILEVMNGDTVTASVTSCNGVAVSAQATILIDPSGIVYDSHSNQPVAGATVSLIDVTGAGNGGSAGGPARVLDANGSGPAPATLVTAADGSYRFPVVAASTYRLAVVPPAGYAFPSKLTPAQQPPNRNTSAQGSYGLSFVISAEDGPVHFDLPLDPGGTGHGLLIQKSADKLTAQVGDFVAYGVQVNNNSGGALPGMLLEDELPAGFAYQRGSARLNGVRLADPAGGEGPSLAFELGTLPQSAQITVTYKVRIGAGAAGGSGTNLAQASSGLLASNRASATVQVTGGVFSDKAYLIGKIFADCNTNGVQDSNEPGIPGVRLYLEDGTYAVSDEQGKYSLYGLTPRMHVAKIDTTTLPAGTHLEVLDHRNAFDAGSAFVDLTNGELHKTDFALDGCGAALAPQIAARRKALKNASEITQAAALLPSANQLNSTVDPRSYAASGAIRLPGASDSPTGSGTPPQQPPMSSGMPGISAFANPTNPLGAAGDPGGPYAPQAQGLPQALQTSTQSQLDGQIAERQAAQNEQDIFRFADVRADSEQAAADLLESRLPHLDGTVAFVNLVDAQKLAATQSTVQVKGPLGTRLLLDVNGAGIAEAQIGKKSSLEANHVLAYEYIGVNLKAGRNLLRVRAVDEFGNERGSAQISVFAPGDLAKIIMETPTDAVADGATAISIHVFLRDAEDLPIGARTEVGLSASLGRWQVPAGESPNLERGPDGNHVFITGGSATLLLLPPAQPGKAALSIVSGGVKTSRAVDFTPNLRPLIGVGLVSGSINLRNLNPAALQPAQSSDVFEREIANLSASFDNGKDDAAARTALFFKGKVLGSTLLTLAYDSDKPSDTTLFRDIQPDQFYPVYGDSSVRGFDAQSTGKLYVMIKNGTNYLLLGDYTTQSDSPARQLTQYSRALNGGKAHWQLGSVGVDGFASETSSSQSIVEFRADGTSGPFQLDLRGVTNSQQVDVITRDRNQPSVILNDTPLTPFSDYAIEPYTGLLLLNNPVPSVDANLNPIYIHVSYSIDTGGPKHWVAGLDSRLQLTPGWAAGATAIHDADPGNELTLEGLNFTGKIDAQTTAIGELARSDSDLLGEGYGERLDLQHQDSRLQAHVWGTHTDVDFYNPNSLQNQGASQYGLKAAYKLDDKDQLVAEGLRTTDATTGAAQTGAELKLQRALAHHVKVEVGVRHSEANAESVLSAPALPGTLSAVTPIAAAASTLPAGSDNAEAGYTSVRAKVTVPVPDVKGAEVFGLAEKAVDGTGGEEDGIGGTYALSSTTRLYAQHDFINSLNGPYTLNPNVSQYTSVAGLTSTLPDTTQLFDEYRVGDGIDGRSAEAAAGLRHQWKLSDGWGVSASLQRITPLSGVASDAASAATFGASYTAPGDIKGSGQTQWETSSSSHTWLFSGAVAYKLAASWTLLERALYTKQTDLDDGDGRELARIQSGFAYRPVASDVWNALAQAEYLRNYDTTLGAGLDLDEQAWIFAGNLNVQPARGWELSARYAAKRAIDWTDGSATTSLTQLAGARSTWDVYSRWDIGVQAYRLWGDGDAEYAFGPQVGYLVWKNLWLRVGYNTQGFRAPDLTGESYTERGAYLHVNFKFDENLLSGAPLPRDSALRGAAVHSP